MAATTGVRPYSLVPRTLLTLQNPVELDARLESFCISALDRHADNHSHTMAIFSFSLKVPFFNASSSLAPSSYIRQR